MEIYYKHKQTSQKNNPMIDKEVIECNSFMNFKTPKKERNFEVYTNIEKFEFPLHPSNTTKDSSFYEPEKRNLSSTKKTQKTENFSSPSNSNNISTEKKSFDSIFDSLTNCLMKSEKTKHMLSPCTNLLSQSPESFEKYLDTFSRESINVMSLFYKKRINEEIQILRDEKACNIELDHRRLLESLDSTKTHKSKAQNREPTEDCLYDSFLLKNNFQKNLNLNINIKLNVTTPKKTKKSKNVKKSKSKKFKHTEFEKAALTSHINKTCNDKLSSTIENALQADPNILLEINNFNNITDNSFHSAKKNSLNSTFNSDYIIKTSVVRKENNISTEFPIKVLDFSSKQIQMNFKSFFDELDAERKNLNKKVTEENNESLKSTNNRDINLASPVFLQKKVKKRATKKASSDDISIIQSNISDLFVTPHKPNRQAKKEGKSSTKKDKDVSNNQKLLATKSENKNIKKDCVFKNKNTQKGRKANKASKEKEKELLEMQLPVSEQHEKQLPVSELHEKQLPVSEQENLCHNQIISNANSSNQICDNTIVDVIFEPALKELKENELIFSDKKGIMNENISNNIENLSFPNVLQTKKEKKRKIFECTDDSTSTALNSFQIFSEKKIIKRRIRKSQFQLHILNEFYEKNNIKYLKKEAIKDLSEKISISPNKIYKWLWDQQNKEKLDCLKSQKLVHLEESIEGCIPYNSKNLATQDKKINICIEEVIDNQNNDSTENSQRKASDLSLFKVDSTKAN